MRAGVSRFLTPQFIDNSRSGIPLTERGRIQIRRHYARLPRCYNSTRPPAVSVFIRLQACCHPCPAGSDSCAKASRADTSVALACYIPKKQAPGAWVRRMVSCPMRVSCHQGSRRVRPESAYGLWYVPCNCSAYIPREFRWRCARHSRLTRTSTSFLLTMRRALSLLAGPNACIYVLCSRTLSSGRGEVETR